MKNKVRGFLIIALSIFASGYLTAGIDPGKSRIDVISRSNEENSPVMGEPLNIRITLRDRDGKPVAGIDGKKISLFIEEGGKLTEKLLSGKSGAAGIIYDVFRPDNIFSGEPVKFAVKIDDAIIQKVIAIRYNQAGELADQGQPLWNGSNRIFGNKTIGQTFICGDIARISRLKIMMCKNADSSNITMPVLKLYEWKNSYQSTIAASPLAVVRSPKFETGRYFGKYLAIYPANCQVQSGTKYYFELSIPDNSGSEAEFIHVYRTWNSPDGNTPVEPDSYPDGMIYFNGQEIPKSDLMFFTFYQDNREGK